MKFLRPLIRFNADSRYCYYRIRQILCNPKIDFFLRSVDSKKKNESCPKFTYK